MVEIERADAVEWLGRRADDSIDLLCCSPEYEDARFYDDPALRRRGQDWVDWMVEVVRAAAPKVKGLIAVVCEGRTRNFRYSATPLLLAADLHRAGFNLRKPLVYRRVGIPGSGGPDWLRNDWEPVVCVTRPGKLAWSNSTACGHPPKWAPGGEMSHRLSDGARVNQWGGNGPIGNKKRDGRRDTHVPPSHKVVITRERPGNHPGVVDKPYAPPALANPGNVVQETYTAAQVAALLREHADGDVVDCIVGGNQMGHPLSHENEAPFPLRLAEFLVKSFCPPEGVVADVFCGSGTTADAAVRHGRHFAGCDNRQSQVDLARRRVADVQAKLSPVAACVPFEMDCTGVSG